MYSKIKILLVSDFTSFALTDVYNGYVKALKSLKINYDSIPLHNLVNFYPKDKCISLMHSQAVLKSNGYTHVFFIGGLNIPESVLESMYGVKVVIIGTEDPHTSKPLIDRIDKIDYYFTNERSLTTLNYSNIYYCPTAADTSSCVYIPENSLDDKFKSDILFLGALYPNRAKLIEGLLPYIKEKNIDLKLCGHMMFIDKESPLWEYVVTSETVDHRDTIRYYNGASITLNIFRDIDWDPRGESINRYKEDVKAVSMNPRCYEVPMCRSILATDDSREEVREIFNNDEVIIFNSADDLIEQIDYHLFEAQEDYIKNKKSRAYNKVATAHTYTHRLRTILKIIS